MVLVLVVVGVGGTCNDVRSAGGAVVVVSRRWRRRWVTTTVRLLSPSQWCILSTKRRRWNDLTASSGREGRIQCAVPRVCKMWWFVKVVRCVI